MNFLMEFSGQETFWSELELAMGEIFNPYA